MERVHALQFALHDNLFKRADAEDELEEVKKREAAKDERIRLLEEQVAVLKEKTGDDEFDAPTLDEMEDEILIGLGFNKDKEKPVPRTGSRPSTPTAWQTITGNVQSGSCELIKEKNKYTVDEVDVGTLECEPFPDIGSDDDEDVIPEDYDSSIRDAVGTRRLGDLVTLCLDKDLTLSECASKFKSWIHDARTDKNFDVEKLLTQYGNRRTEIKNDGLVCNQLIAVVLYAIACDLEKHTTDIPVGFLEDAALKAVKYFKTSESKIIQGEMMGAFHLLHVLTGHLTDEAGNEIKVKKMDILVDVLLKQKQETEQQAMEKQRKKIRKGKSARGAFANLDEELVISTRHKKKSRKSSGDVG